jgi:hypothetical protein
VCFRVKLRDLLSEYDSRFARMPTSQNRDMGHPAPRHLRCEWEEEHSTAKTNTGVLPLRRAQGQNDNPKFAQNDIWVVCETAESISASPGATSIFLKLRSQEFKCAMQNGDCLSNFLRPMCGSHNPDKSTQARSAGDPVNRCKCG